MTALLVSIAIVVGIALFVMPAAQRARLFYSIRVFLRDLQGSLTRVDPEDDDFKAALAARTRFALITVAISGALAGVFVLMLFGAGSLSNPQTIVSWGGSVGPLTTNGEWWRLITALFVHTWIVPVVINVAVLLQLGLVLERLVGRLTFAAVFVSAGLIANLITMAAYRVDVTSGASGAICGLYGLLLAAAFWTRHASSPLAVPPERLKKIAILATAFVICNSLNGGVSLAGELTALVLGFACGMVLTRTVHESLPARRMLGATMGVAAALVLALAIPLRGIADVRPEISSIVALEDKTAGEYATALSRFSKGGMTADALALLISKQIVPELQAAEERIKALSKVPPEHQELVETAQEYLRLRTEGWRLRVEGLRRSSDAPKYDDGDGQPGSHARWRLRAETQYRANLNTLAKAENAERRSLEAFERLKNL